MKITHWHVMCHATCHTTCHAMCRATCHATCRAPCCATCLAMCHCDVSLNVSRDTSHVTQHVTQRVTWCEKTNSHAIYLLEQIFPLYIITSNYMIIFLLIPDHFPLVISCFDNLPTVHPMDRMKVVRPEIIIFWLNLRKVLTQTLPYFREAKMD